MNTIVEAPNFPATTTSITQLLNCCRVLSRIIPYIFENPECWDWEDKVFWVPRSVERRVDLPPASDQNQESNDSSQQVDRTCREKKERCQHHRVFDIRSHVLSMIRYGLVVKYLCHVG